MEIGSTNMRAHHAPAGTEGSARGSGEGRRGLETFARVMQTGAGVIRAVVPGAGALPGSDNRMDRMWELQEQSQGFQMEMIALQHAIQQDNQHFTTLSNVIRARHDTARAAISNIRS